MINSCFLKIFIPLCVISFFSCGGKYDDQYEFSIRPVEFSKKGDTNILFIETTLSNNTWDTLKYLSMTCGWDAIYIVDNDRIDVEREKNCYTNVPKIIKVRPQMNSKTFFNINLGKVTKGSGEKMKLGIEIITVENEKDLLEKAKGFFDKSKRRDSENVIWSNEVEL